MVRSSGKLDSLQNADGFHHDGAAGSIVGGASAAMPGIEVCTQHNEFIFMFSGAGNLADYVEAIRMAFIDIVFDIEFQFHGDVVFHEAGDAIVLFRHETTAGRPTGFLGS